MVLSIACGDNFSLAKLVKEAFRNLTGLYGGAVRKLTFELLLSNEGFHFLADVGSRHYEVVFKELWIVHCELTRSARLNTHISLEVKVKSLWLLLLRVAVVRVLPVDRL